MPDIPHHPGDEADNHGVVDGEGSSTARSRSVWAWWAVGITLLVLFVVLHLTGVLGPGSH